MKFKWGSCFILFIVIVITVFGIFEKRTYTNIAEDKSYLDELYVAQLPENICLEETENLSVNLPQVPVIIRVSVLGDVEHIGGTSRQLVKVEDVYKGTEPAVGQDIYLTCSRWSLSLYSEPYSIERGFVNIMEVGEEYLVFIENQADGLGEKIPVYQVYVENAFTPIFSYQEHENNICETGGESTYVKYNQVCENEFFATTQKNIMKSENYSLMNLEKLNIQEEMNYSCDTMLHIYPTANMDYSVLTDREKSILDKVITKFSAYRAKDIVEYMHKEKAYTETRPGEIILFSLAKEIRKF